MSLEREIDEYLDANPEFKADYPKAAELLGRAKEEILDCPNEVYTCKLDRGICSNQYSLKYMTGCRSTRKCKDGEWSRRP